MPATQSARSASTGSIRLVASAEAYAQSEYKRRLAAATGNATAITSAIVPRNIDG